MIDLLSSKVIGCSLGLIDLGLTEVISRKHLVDCLVHSMEVDGVEDVSVPLTVSSGSTQAVVLDVSDASSSHGQERKVLRVRAESADVRELRVGDAPSSSSTVEYAQLRN